MYKTDGEMKIALYQQDIVWGVPAENMRRAEAAFAAGLVDHPFDSAYEAGHADGGRSVDLIVLPEMFTTGYCADPSQSDTAIDDGMQAVTWMRHIAGRHGAAVAGSVAVADKGWYYNRLYFVRPDGGVEYYDKRHLFAMGGEADHYTAGRRRVVVEWRGVRILLQVCYDLRFPVFSRNRGDYDMIIYSANWPTPRIAVWDTLLRARAIENQCYVAGVNRAGRDPWCEYCGHTVLVDAYGRVVTSCTDGDVLVIGDVDMDALAAFRRKFPVLDDRDAWPVGDAWDA